MPSIYNTCITNMINRWVYLCVCLRAGVLVGLDFVGNALSAFPRILTYSAGHNLALKSVRTKGFKATF